MLPVNEASLLVHTHDRSSLGGELTTQTTTDDDIITVRVHKTNKLDRDNTTGLQNVIQAL